MNMPKIFLSFLFLLVTAHSGFAQEDTNKVNRLKEQSLRYARDNRPDPGIKAGLECLALAEKLKWRKGIAAGNYCVATNYMFKSDYPQALKYSLNQLKEDDAGDRRELYVGYRNAGLIYSLLHQYQKSLTYYFSALKMAEALGDGDEIARAKGNISICYEDIGDYDMAKEYLAAALHDDKLMGGRAFDNTSSEYLSPPAYEFKVLKIKQRLEALKVLEESTDDAGHVYKDPLDSIKNRESLLRAAIYNEYEKKKAAARTEAERQQLTKEQEDKQKQLSAFFAQKAEKDSILLQYNEAKARSKLDSTNKVNEAERTRLEEDRKRQAQINEANLKTTRTYSYAAVTVACLLSIIVFITIFAYRQNRRDNLLIKKLVNEQEHIIEQRTKELGESNERLAHANKKLVELVQYNAHRMREPLTRVMGAMAMLEYTTPEEFCKEITPEIQRAVGDLDNSIMQVITLADESIEQFSK